MTRFCVSYLIRTALLRGPDPAVMASAQAPIGPPVESLPDLLASTGNRPSGFCHASRHVLAARGQQS
jgi:hypothetical protein